MSDETALQPQIKIAWIFWTLLAFTIFAVIGLYSSRMTHDYVDYDQQRAADRIATLEKLRATETQTLTTADWVDQSKGIIRIPINEAMTRELADLKNKPVAMGSPLVIPTTPAPAPASTNAATTNAAPAAPAKEAKK